MLKLREVEAAKMLMSEAVNWSVMRWLAEKKRVRKAADLANDALDALDRELKAGWSVELQAAYDELSSVSTNKPGDQHQGNGKKLNSDSGIKILAKQLKQADDEAYRARMDAEDTFDRAEKRLSTSMAREGSRKAITSWVLHEKAIVLSEAAIGAGKAK
jgi:phosphatidate phosphatase PAH1